LRHCTKENSSILYSVLCDAVKRHCSTNKDNEEVLGYYVDILTEAISFKDGNYVDKRHILMVNVVTLTYHSLLVF